MKFPMPVDTVTSRTNIRLVPMAVSSSMFDRKRKMLTSIDCIPIGIVLRDKHGQLCTLTTMGRVQWLDPEIAKKVQGP